MVCCLAGSGPAWWGASRAGWWSRWGSNPRPLECDSSALPTELRPQPVRLYGERVRRCQGRGASGKETSDADRSGRPRRPARGRPAARPPDQRSRRDAPGSAHALDLAGLRSPDISLWAVWDGETLLGFGALKRLSANDGEVKSMHVAEAARRRGIGGAMLRHIIAAAREEGMGRLSLET